MIFQTARFRRRKSWKWRKDSKRMQSDSATSKTVSGNRHVSNQRHQISISYGCIVRKRVPVQNYRYIRDSHSIQVSVLLKTLVHRIKALYLRFSMTITHNRKLMLFIGHSTQEEMVLVYQVYCVVPDLPHKVILNQYFLRMDQMEGKGRCQMIRLPQAQMQEPCPGQKTALYYSLILKEAGNLALISCQVILNQLSLQYSATMNSIQHPPIPQGKSLFGRSLREIRRHIKISYGA